MSCLVENRFLLIFLKVLVFTTIISLLPIVLLAVVILIPLRALLTLYKNWFLPDYGDLLTGMDNIFGSSDPYIYNPELNLGCHGWIKGHLKLEDFQQLCQRKLNEFQKHHPDPWFRELKQYLTTWLGFSVWRDEPYFNIADHVKMLGDVDPIKGQMEINEDNVADLCFQLNKVPYKKDTSPWEFIIHHNVRYKDMIGRDAMTSNDEIIGEPVTLIVTKFHHGLCDALAVLNVLSHIFEQPEAYQRFINKFSKSLGHVKNRKRGWVKRWWYILSYPILGLCEVINHTFDVWDDNVWHTGWPKTRRDFLFTSFDSIPTHRIKRVREAHGGVKFVTVCTAAMAGGIRKYMNRHDLVIPQSMHAAISIATPKKTTKLGNQIFGSSIPIPTGLNDRTQILEFIDHGIRSFQTSRLPMTMYGISYIIGLLPVKYVGRFLIFTTSIMTNFPGFDTVLKICGCPLVAIRGFSVLRSTAGIYFFVSGYKGQLDILLGVSKHIMSNMNQVLELRHDIEEEFEILEKDPKNNLIIDPPPTINTQSNRHKMG